jgi:hypothetical protein
MLFHGSASILRDCTFECVDLRQLNAGSDRGRPSHSIYREVTSEAEHALETMWTSRRLSCWGAEIFRLSSVVFNDLIKTEPSMQQAVLRILAGEVRVARQALSELSLWSEV